MLKLHIKKSSSLNFPMMDHTCITYHRSQAVLWLGIFMAPLLTILIYMRYIYIIMLVKLSHILAGLLCIPNSGWASWIWNRKKWLYYKMVIQYIIQCLILTIGIIHAILSIVSSYSRCKFDSTPNYICLLWIWN